MNVQVRYQLRYDPLEDVLKGFFALMISIAKHLSIWRKPYFFVAITVVQKAKIILSGTFKTSS
ncbi:hypothetical protein [Nostoc sp.]|uniref:hypothetical protein n=1 Tax=Nostoc sp. TaxID=1180 RepID=UPI002FFA603C